MLRKKQNNLRRETTVYLNIHTFQEVVLWSFLLFVCVKMIAEWQ